jgi:hypothetical protein
MRRLLNYAAWGFWLSVPVSVFFPVLLAPVLGGEAAIRVYLCYVGVVLAVCFWMFCRWIAERVIEDRIRKQATRFYESDEGKRFLEEQAEKWRQLDDELQRRREREAKEWHNWLLSPDPAPPTLTKNLDG